VRIGSVEPASFTPEDQPLLLLSHRQIYNQIVRAGSSQ
jgi:hypothetical protein